MAFKMKGSPHKRGVIQGTESALKLGGLIKLGKLIYKGAKRLIKGSNRKPTRQYRPNEPQRGARNPDGTRR